MSTGAPTTEQGAGSPDFLGTITGFLSDIAAPAASVASSYFQAEAANDGAQAVLNWQAQSQAQTVQSTERNYALIKWIAGAALIGLVLATALKD